jgi:proteasome-associated ATPase
VSLLEVRGLCRSFFGVHALRSVDLGVEAHRITGLIGPNGAGKTTLFNCISGVVPPDSGTVHFDGRDITGWRPDRIASHDIFGIYLHPGVPLDPDTLRECGNDPEGAREMLVAGATDYLFQETAQTEFLEVHLHNGGVQMLYWKDLVSGALVMSVVERAKDFAIRRAIELKNPEEGIGLPDLERAIRLEYKENEIFPKSDAQEDWLKLLDHDPENVAGIRPIRPDRDRRRGQSII